MSTEIKETFDPRRNEVDNSDARPTHEGVLLQNGVFPTIRADACGRVTLTALPSSGGVTIQVGGPSSMDPVRLRDSDDVSVIKRPVSYDSSDTWNFESEYDFCNLDRRAIKKRRIKTSIQEVQPPVNVVVVINNAPTQVQDTLNLRIARTDVPANFRTISVVYYDHVRTVGRNLFQGTLAAIMSNDFVRNLGGELITGIFTGTVIELLKEWVLKTFF